MKIIFIIILLLLVLLGTAQQFYNGVPTTLPFIANPTNVTSAQYIQNQTRGDTMVCTGTGLADWLFKNVNGLDSLHPFVVYCNGTTGLGATIISCKYLKFIGINATITGGGTNGSIRGLVDYVQVSGFTNLNGGVGGWWIKTEVTDACTVSDFPDPYAVLYPARMKHIWFTHNKFGNPDGTNSCGGEPIYAGSTGSQGDRPVPCLNDTLLKPMWMQDIHLDSNTIYSCGRSGIQLSGADLGTNTIIGNYVVHAGAEFNQNQGAGIRLGYGTSSTTEVAYNYVKYSYLYNYDIETGGYVHDNYGDSAGYYDATHVNPQGVANWICYAQLPNSTLILKNNEAGWGNLAPNPTRYAIYGSDNFTDQNIVCNNIGRFDVLQEPFIYSSDCTGGDTTCSDITYQVTHDTVVVGHFTRLENCRDTTYFISNAPFERHFTIWLRYVGGNRGETVTETICDVVEYDSAYLVKNGAVHDTTVTVCTVGLQMGVMPSDSAAAIGVHTTRKVAFTSTFSGGTAYPPEDTILLNIDYNLLHNFTTDTTTFKTKCIEIATTLQPSLVIVENEEYLHGDIVEYCNELKAAAHGLMPLGFKVTNGGFVLPSIGYWYYSKTQDAQFLANNFFRQSQRDSLVNGDFDDVIADMEFEIQVIMELNLYAVDVHYYLGNANQQAGITDMLNYLSGYTGLPIIVTEAGIFSEGLLRNVVQIARAAQATHCILYDGNDAGGNALDFTEQEYQEAVQP